MKRSLLGLIAALSFAFTVAQAAPRIQNRQTTSSRTFRGEAMDSARWRTGHGEGDVRRLKQDDYCRFDDTFPDDRFHREGSSVRSGALAGDGATRVYSFLYIPVRRGLRSRRRKITR